MPVVPQVTSPWFAHPSLGSVSSLIGPHVPSTPPPLQTPLHATQGPSHAVSQQYWSTQNPLAHSVGSEQSCCAAAGRVAKSEPTSTHTGRSARGRTRAL